MLALSEIESKVARIIEEELTQMIDNILGNHIKNQRNRSNNPFNCFEDPYIKNYMGMGRSFDSQLGNRLQNIAFKLCCLDESKIAPNHFVFNICDDRLYVSTIYDNKCKQFISITDNEYEMEYVFHVPITEDQKEYLLSLNSLYKAKNGVIGIPVDLIYFDKSDECFYAFELKAGGNLDTKNADANFNEVIRLMRILEPFEDSMSYFATCYNNMGECANPQGSIFEKLNEEQLLIGSKFWNKVLPSEIFYIRFIEIYQYIFREIVKVDKRLQVVYE